MEMESSHVDPHGIIPTYYTLNRDRKVITAEQIIYRLHNLPAYHVAPQSSQVKKKKKADLGPTLKSTSKQLRIVENRIWVSINYEELL